MIEEMRAKFGPRFLETARGRIRLSLELLGKPNETNALIIELHSLAGEASMLGLNELSDTARAGENHAKEWKRGSTTAKLYCARSVRTLTRQIEEFAATLGLSAAPPATPEPAAEPSPPGAGPGTPSDAGAGTGDSSPRVLIIDDSRLAGDHLCAALEQTGVTARLALTEQVALAELEQFEPQLVVCDVHMPGIDLGQLCVTLRQRTRRPIAILLLSGMSESELARRASEVGADGHVSKHAGITNVVERIKSALPAMSLPRDGEQTP